MYFNKQHRIAVYSISILVFIILITLLIIQGVYIPISPYFIPISQRINNAFGCGLIIAFIFPALIEYNNMVWLRSVDDNTPRLLMDITEAVRSGVPLLVALEDATTRNYGPISAKLSNVMARFKLTSDFRGELNRLSEELVRPVVKRMNTLLLEAYQMGGQAIDVLDASVNLFTQIAEYREERQSKMKSYVLIIYVGSIIFLIISYVIFTKFIVPIHVIAMDPSLIGTGLFESLHEVQYFKSILYWASIIQSIFGGLVAGKIGSGRLSGGLIHVVSLLVITILFFNTFSI